MPNSTILPLMQRISDSTSWPELVSTLQGLDAKSPFSPGRKKMTENSARKIVTQHTSRWLHQKAELSRFGSAGCLTEPARHLLCSEAFSK